MTDAEHIRQLELLLLDPKTRQSAGKLDNMLCDGFIEVGQSGTIYNKADVIIALTEDPLTEAGLSNFDIRVLSKTLILASYTSKGEARVRRHSLWEKHGQTWRILYHEAEKTGG